MRLIRLIWVMVVMVWKVVDDANTLAAAVVLPRSAVLSASRSVASAAHLVAHIKQ